MKKNLYVAGILMVTLFPVLLLTQTLSNASANPAALDGKAIFVSENCSNCHAVSSAGIEAKIKSEKMKGPDLTGFAAKHDKAWIAKYLRKQEALDGVQHKLPFKGTDEELQALVDWLIEQKQ